MTPPDPELVAAAVEAVRGGASLRDAAEAAGVSHVTVSRWCRAAGVTPPQGTPGRPPKLSPAGKARARARKRQGATTAQVAAELGVSRDVVERANAAPYAGIGPAEPPPEPVPALTAEQLSRDPLEVAKETYLLLDTHLRRELAAGNAERVSALMTRLNAQLETIRKLEESRRTDDGAGVVTFTREQLERGAKVVAERIAAEAERRRLHGGLTCVRCGEALTLALAQPVQDKPT